MVLEKISVTGVICVSGVMANLLVEEIYCVFVL